ncbi:flagellin [Ferrimonas lipolytica]|nr:flagellin [Ferrimonas lipolytica]
MLSVQTNYASLVGQNALTQANNEMTTAMERLSTGYRINGASDDAAGLQIASRLEADSTALQQGTRNVNDAIAMLETADGALSEVESIAMRMTELSTQYGSATVSADDQDAITAEFDGLKDELISITTETEFAGEDLFGKFDAAVTVDAGVGKTVTVDATAEIAALDTAIAALDVTDIATVDTTIDALGDTRSVLGSGINRLQHTANNNANIDENTQQALSNIKDADYATESSNMTKNEMLVQAGTNVLAKSNQNTSLVMSLLG